MPTTHSTHSSKEITEIEDNDFGFSFVDENEIKNETDDVAKRLQTMYNAILPLLKNLKKNPQQEHIKWPNRVEKIMEFKQKLDEIGGNYIEVKKI